MLGRQFILVGLLASAIATLLAPDLGVLPPDFSLSKVFLIFAGVTLLIGVPWWLVEISQGLRKRSGSTGVGDAGHGSEDS